MVVETDSSREVRPDIAKLAVDAQWDLLEMRKITLSLEAIFLELTTQEEPIDPVAESADAAETPDDSVPTEQERA